MKEQWEEKITKKAFASGRISCHAQSDDIELQTAIVRSAPFSRNSTQAFRDPCRSVTQEGVTSVSLIISLFKHCVSPASCFRKPSSDFRAKLQRASMKHFFGERVVTAPDGVFAWPPLERGQYRE